MTVYKGIVGPQFLYFIAQEHEISTVWLHCCVLAQQDACGRQTASCFFNILKKIICGRINWAAEKYASVTWLRFHAACTAEEHKKNPPTKQTEPDYNSDWPRPTTVPPCRDATVARAASWLLETTATLQPLCASRRDTALPMPLEPPHTTASLDMTLWRRRTHQHTTYSLIWDTALKLKCFFIDTENVNRNCS